MGILEEEFLERVRQVSHEKKDGGLGATVFLGGGLINYLLGLGFCKAT